MIRTIPHLLADAVAAVPGKQWLFHERDTYTFAEAHEQIRRAAGGLAERGVRAGDLVVATTRNTPAYLFTWLGAMQAGAVFVPANPAGSESELEGLVQQVQPRLVVTDDGCDVLTLFVREGDLPERADGAGLSAGT